jgi:hypothetical protein
MDTAQRDVDALDRGPTITPRSCSWLAQAPSCASSVTPTSTTLPTNPAAKSSSNPDADSQPHDALMHCFPPATPQS